MIAIGKPIDGITLNGLEWLLNENGDVMKFESREIAQNFLKDNGFKELSDEEIEDSFIFEDDEEIEDSFISEDDEEIEDSFISEDDELNGKS